MFYSNYDIERMLLLQKELMDEKNFKTRNGERTCRQCGFNEQRAARSCLSADCPFKEKCR